MKARYWQTAVLYGAAAALPWVVAAVLWRAPVPALSPAPARATDAELADRIAALTTENLELRRRLAAVQELRTAGLADWQRLEARLLTRSRRPGRALVTIDRGTLHGVGNGMAAVDGTRLLGVVAGEQPEAAVVRLLRDQDFRLPVLILPPPGVDRQATQGVLIGGAEPRVELVPVRDGEDLQPGQAIVTAAGLHRPAGLHVAVIIEAEPRRDQPSWRISARWLAGSQPGHRLTVLSDGGLPGALAPSAPARPLTLPTVPGGG